MYLKISKILFILLIFNCISTFAQKKDEAEIQREKLIQKLEDDQDERNQEFVNELKVDDFQREIIKQKLQSYYQEKKAIYFSNIKYYEKEEQLKTLDATYFSDLKELVSEDVIKSIQDFVKDNKQELKKKKRKKNKKNN